MIYVRETYNLGNIIALCVLYDDSEMLKTIYSENSREKLKKQNKTDDTF